MLRQTIIDTPHSDQQWCPVCDATPVVVDESDFPACCQGALDRMPPARVMVVGPEQDTSYRTLALTNGIGGWVSRDHIADELSSAMRTALGCHHHPCPPSRRPAAGTTTATSHTGGRSR